MAVAAIAIASVSALGGCVVNEIHDEIAMANTQLDTKRVTLNAVNERLDRVSTQLDDLERTTNSLIELQQQLEVLNSIDNSLKNLDRHLASLRGTIESIDRTIPFLRFSGDAEDEEDLDEETLEEIEAILEGAREREDAGSGEDKPAAEGGGESAAESESSREDGKEDGKVDK